MLCRKYIARQRFLEKINIGFLSTTLRSSDSLPFHNFSELYTQVVDDLSLRLSVRVGEDNCTVLNCCWGLYWHNATA